MKFTPHDAAQARAATGRFCEFGGGALGGVAVPWLMKSMGLSWNGVLYVAATTYLISALCWMFIDSDQRLDE